MTSIHRLQHVECFATTALTNDNSLGAHTEGVHHQITNGNFTSPFNIWRAGFKRNHMLLTQLQFSSIFYCYDTFIIRDETGKHIQKCGFARTSTARDNNI